MYHWLLVEGIYLYMKVALVYNSERIKLWMYKLVGWVRVNNKKIWLSINIGLRAWYNINLENSSSNREFNNTFKQYPLISIEILNNIVLAWNQ